MAPKKLTVEDMFSDELKREMNMDTETFAVIDDWDSVLHSVYQMPIEYAGYTNRVGDMKISEGNDRHASHLEF